MLIWVSATVADGMPNPRKSSPLDVMTTSNAGPSPTFTKRYVVSRSHRGSDHLGRSLGMSRAPVTRLKLRRTHVLLGFCGLCADYGGKIPGQRVALPVVDELQVDVEVGCLQDPDDFLQVIPALGLHAQLIALDL